MAGMKTHTLNPAMGSTDNTRGETQPPEYYTTVRQYLDSLVEAKRMLRELDVIRSERLVGELGEWFAEAVFGGARAVSTSEKGHDIINRGRKVQVKTHAKGDNNNARWTEFKYRRGEFDDFIIIVMTKEFRLKEVYHIPEEVVFERINEDKKQRVLDWDAYPEYSVPLDELPNQELVSLFR